MYEIQNQQLQTLLSKRSNDAKSAAAVHNDAAADVGALSGLLS